MREKLKTILTKEEWKELEENADWFLRMHNNKIQAYQREKEIENNAIDFLLEYVWDDENPQIEDNMYHCEIAGRDAINGNPLL